MYYVLQLASQSHCKYCRNPVRLLCNQAGWIDRSHPAFYICFTCNKVFQVGVGEVEAESLAGEIRRECTPKRPVHSAE